MLSATYTITDVKAELVNGYAYYGYADDNAFVAQLTRRVADARLIDLIPIITQGFYDSIAAKDKVNLELKETYIYQAEIFFTVARFLKKESLIINQSNTGGEESITTEGYSRTITTSSVGTTGKTVMGEYFEKEAIRCLAMAGYKNMYQLQRGNSMLSGYTEGLNIL
jgi:hypothetical protein